MNKIVNYLGIIPALLLSAHLSGQSAADSLWPPLFRTELRDPVNLKNSGSNTWIADFGKAAFGTVEVTFGSASNGTAIIKIGEKALLSGEPDPNPGGTVRYSEVTIQAKEGLHKYLVSFPPDKRNTNPPAVPLPDSFGVIVPFRYCSLTAENIIGEPVFRQLAYIYKFNDAASDFKSSDTTLNRIWELCKYSIRATSFAGYYIDGDRERIPYEADAYINQLSHYAVDNEYTLAKRTNEYFIYNPTWPTEWILHTLLLFYNDYMYTGDIEQIRRHYSSLKTKTLVSLAGDDGLISSSSPALTDSLMSELGFRNNRQRLRDIVDWPPAQKDTGWKLATAEGERDGYDMRPVNTVVNAFHYMNLVIMAQLARQLGHNDDAEFFSARAVTVKNSFNSKLLDKTKGIYIDGIGSVHSSLHANMMALAAGLVEKENMAGVIAFIKSRDMACSVYGAQYLLDALYESGEASYGMKLLTSTGDRSWYNMIRAGSTITLEAWDAKYKPNLDWNHAWGAAPANIIVRRIWGIRPAEPGFKKAVIEPQPEGLTWSEIIAPTKAGPIKCKYKLNRVSGKELYTIIIPEGMSAEFLISNGMRKIVSVNGKKSLNNSYAELSIGENTVTVSAKYKYQ